MLFRPSLFDRYILYLHAGYDPFRDVALIALSWCNAIDSFIVPPRNEIAMTVPSEACGQCDNLTVFDESEWETITMPDDGKNLLHSDSSERTCVQISLQG